MSPDARNDDPTDEPAPSVLLGRQPIVDRSGALVAYELLFRAGFANTATISDDGKATDQVILNALAQFGVAASLGAHRGFINIGRASLRSDTLYLLEPGRFTLEILENVAIDAEVAAGCCRLRQAGFQIALDDVVSIERIPASVLALVDVVKIDLRSVIAAELPLIVRAAHAAGCRVLAEKVETREEFRRILDQGADLFQGYFFARPEVLRQSQVSASQLALLQLSNVLAGDPSLTELQREVKRNPVLLAQLMKFANSAFASARPDLTVGEAIARIGTRQLARLAQLLLFASDGRERLEDDPLLQLVSTRARFMELMACAIRPGDDAFADAAFQTGVFSLMHVVVQQTSEQLLEQVRPGARIQAAILRLDGELGDLLRVAQLMEDFEPVETAVPMRRHGLDPDRLNALFARAALEILGSA
ncbi:EAL domain-containing protein [Comamonadaceae bacterium OTU4NAUVB1]|nr:EAL domain-containing protein [Comamonadaceae bacterium OTU4NAUVB1]